MPIEPDSSEPPWRNGAWIARTRVILSSYRRILGRDLLPSPSTDVEASRLLFDAPFVVVAHGTEVDPILNYANRAALELWEAGLAALLAMPSRQTAEPVHRDERASMLHRTRTLGYLDDYSGIRISATGRRFRIREAVIWNLADDEGRPAGQAAAFSRWEYLDVHRPPA